MPATVLTTSAPLSASGQSRSRNERLNGLIPRWLARTGWFFPFLALYELTSYLLMVRDDLYFGDGTSRTAMATMVLFSRDPHLGAIGLVWTPLPAILQLPVLIVLSLLALPLQLAGPLVTGVFGATNVVLIDRMGRAAGVNPLLRVTAVLVYGLHPLVWLYAASGMSEPLFATCIILMIHFWLRWSSEPGSANLAGASLSLAGAWWSRYESIGFTAGLAAALAVTLVLQRKRLRHVEGILIVGLAPFVYSLLLWLFFNWMLVGDAIYFYTGPYSNVANVAGSGTAEAMLGPAAGVVHAPIRALEFIATRTATSFFAIIPLALAGVWLVIRRRDYGLLGLLIILGALPAFYEYELYAGQLFPWYRFYILVPVGAIAIGFYLSTRGSPRANRRFSYVLVGLLLLSEGIAVASMTWSEVAFIEIPYLKVIFGQRNDNPASLFLTEDRAVANDVSSLPDGLVLMDSSVGERIFLLAPNHKRFVIISDRDYATVLADPRRYVRYILVARPGTVNYDTIQLRYPLIYDHGADWLTLLKTYPGPTAWRLFQVAPPKNDVVAGK